MSATSQDTENSVIPALFPTGRGAFPETGQLTGRWSCGRHHNVDRVGMELAGFPGTSLVNTVVQAGQCHHCKQTNCGFVFYRFSLSQPLGTLQEVE